MKPNRYDIKMAERYDELRKRNRRSEWITGGVMIALAVALLAVGWRWMK